MLFQFDSKGFIIKEFLFEENQEIPELSIDSYP